MSDNNNNTPAQPGQNEQSDKSRITLALTDQATIQQLTSAGRAAQERSKEAKATARAGGSTAEARRQSISHGSDVSSTSPPRQATSTEQAVSAGSSTATTMPTVTEKSTESTTDQKGE